MKEALRTDGNSAVWQAWTATQNQLRQLRQPAPPLVFPGEAEIFRDMYTQVGEEGQIISLPDTRIHACQGPSWTKPYGRHYAAWPSDGR